MIYFINMKLTTMNYYIVEDRQSISIALGYRGVPTIMNQYGTISIAMNTQIPFVNGILTIQVGLIKLFLNDN